MKIPGALYNVLAAALAAAVIAGADVIEAALQTQLADWVLAPLALAAVGVVVSYVNARVKTPTGPAASRSALDASETRRDDVTRRFLLG